MILLDDIEEKVYWGIAKSKSKSYDEIDPRDMRLIFEGDKLEFKYVEILKTP